MEPQLQVAEESEESNGRGEDRSAKRARADEGLRVAKGCNDASRGGGNGDRTGGHEAKGPTKDNDRIKPAAQRLLLAKIVGLKPNHPLSQNGVVVVVIITITLIIIIIIIVIIIIIIIGIIIIIITIIIIIIINIISSFIVICQQTVQIYVTLVVVMVI